jgi:hypothetical protein
MAPNEIDTITINPDDVGSVAPLVGSGGIGGIGVKGLAIEGTGVKGEAAGDKGTGVKGEATGDKGTGVKGKGGAIGVWGHSTIGTGVYGESHAPANVGAAGVWGDGKEGSDGVKGVAQAPGKAAVAGYQLGDNGPGIFGQGSPAGHFEGDVRITNNLRIDGDITLAPADCAEDFDIADAALVEPGTVMVLGEEGVLCPSLYAYDKRVAGVVSRAGDYKPGIILDRQQSRTNRKPIALLGKVYCKVDASYASIEIGDLLTTSDRPGHAMKAADPLKAFGSVIGKALRPFKTGQGLIPILVALQ